MEQWKVIKTHPNYKISNLGRVINIKTNEFKNSSPDREGYISVSLYPNLKVYRVHRLVAEHFIPNKDKTKTLVNHIDGVRYNNFVENLEWVTSQENAKHMVALGNNKDHNGVNNPRSKFTEQEILKIRNADFKIPDKVLAEQLGENQSTITNIRNGTRYKNVGGPIREKNKKINQVTGSKVSSAKITEKTAEQIKYADSSISTKDLADLYKISWHIVNRIRKNITWQHI